MQGNMSLFDRIATIIGAAQRNSGTHQKGVVQLKKIFLHEDFESSMLALKKCIYSFLLVDYYNENHRFTDRFLTFLSLVCTLMQDHHMEYIDTETDSPCIMQIIKFLIEMTCVASENIRCRACQFISKILQGMTGYDLSEELCDMVQDAMLNVLGEKVSKIRQYAVHALSPLQNPNSPNCPVINAFLEHMEFDSSPKVRQMCAEKLVLRRNVIPHLIAASLDVSGHVRMAVYKRALKYPNHLNISQKQTLLLNAMQDPSENVKKFVAEQMIGSWLQFYNADYIQMIKALRLDATWKALEESTKVSEFVLGILFEQRPIEEILGALKLTELKLVQLEELNWDVAIFWRVLIEYLRKSGDKKFVEIDDYTPQIPHLRDYIQEFCAYSMNRINSNPGDAFVNLEFKFVLVQLFKIVRGCDFSDVVCKQVMNELIQHVLRSFQLELEVINPIMQAFNKTMPNVSEQTRFICEFITADLLQPQEQDKATKKTTQTSSSTLPAKTVVQPAPTETARLNSTQIQCEIVQLKIKMYTLSDELEAAVRDQDYLKASKLKPLIDELNARITQMQQPEHPLPSEPSIPEELEDDADVSEEAPRIIRTDPAVIHRCLNIMAAFLTCSDIRAMDPTLSTFKLTFIDELVRSDKLRIRVAALRCLGLCCTIDEHIAVEAMPAFFAIIEMHNHVTQASLGSELTLICIGTVVDSLILYGAKIFGEVADESLASASAYAESISRTSSSISLTRIIRQLLELLDDEDASIQELAGRGICNLLLTSRIQSHLIITRLILKYALPVPSDDEDLMKLQQYIGVTLSKLPEISGMAIPYQKAILPAIRVILKAPKNSPLANVDVDNLAKLLINLCATFPEADNIYYYLSDIILRDMCDKPMNPHHLMFSKILGLMQISPSINADHLNNIVHSIDDVRNQVADERILANIVKFNTKLTLLVQPDVNTDVENRVVQPDDSPNHET